MIKFPPIPSQEELDRGLKELAAFKECMEICADCIDLLDTPYYKNDTVVFREDDRHLKNLLKRFDSEIRIIYPEGEFRETNLLHFVKRMKGFGKCNGIYRQEVKDVVATLLFHSLIYNAYKLDQITKTADGITVKLKEGTLI